MSSVFDPQPLLSVLEGLHAAIADGTLPDAILIIDVDGNPIVTHDQVRQAYQALPGGDIIEVLKPLIAIGGACAWSRIKGIAFGQYDDTPLIRDATGAPLVTVKQAMNAAALQLKHEVARTHF